jgi:hypothetical protein
MDTALENGDFSPGANGRPRLIGGREELLQRAKIRLAVPRGSFSADPALGSRLHTLTGDEEDPDRPALFYAREALSPLPQAAAESAEYLPGPPPAVRVALVCGGEQSELEVKL